MNPLIETIRARRSIRKYLDKKVPPEVIETLLSCAVYAPSARAIFPCNFIVIENRDKIRELSDKAKKTIKFLGLAASFAERITTRKDLIFYGAPVVIIITSKRNVKWRKEDSALALENMFLAAQSLGLGSCWIGLAQGLDKDEETRNDLGIPADHEITAIAIFGYPAEKKETPKREARVTKWIK